MPRGTRTCTRWFPWIVLLLAVAVGVFLRALGRAFVGQSSVSRCTISFVGLWLVCALALVAIYTCQEFLEGLFLTGHPGGLMGIFGYGGWWSVPAAGAVGLILAAVFHTAGWVLNEVAQRYRRERSPEPRSDTPTRLPRDVLLPAPAGHRLVRPGATQDGLLTASAWRQPD